jgi:hypothetical protein
MAQANQFYTTTGKKEISFAIKDPGPVTWRGFGMAFSYGNGDIRGGESHSSPTTAKDYDNIFFEKLVNTHPPYVIEEILDFHFKNFLQKTDADSSLFLKHMQYVIAPMFRLAKQEPHHEILLDWVTTKKQAMVKAQEGSSEKKQSEPAINLSVGNNSLVQIQHGHTMAPQYAQQTGMDPEQLRLWIEEIKNNYEALRKDLGTIEFKHLVEQTTHLEKELQKETGNPSARQIVVKTILDILKSIPANLIANMLTTQIPM